MADKNVIEQPSEQPVEQQTTYKVRVVASGGAKLREYDTFDSDTIMIIEQGTELDVIISSTEFVKVRYESEVGYVRNRPFVIENVE